MPIRELTQSSCFMVFIKAFLGTQAACPLGAHSLTREVGCKQGARQEGRGGREMPVSMQWWVSRAETRDPSG